MIRTHSTELRVRLIGRPRRVGEGSGAIGSVEASVTRSLMLPAPVAAEDSPGSAARGIAIALDHLRIGAEPQQQPLEPGVLGDPQADATAAVVELVHRFER